MLVRRWFLVALLATLLPLQWGTGVAHCLRLAAGMAVADGAATAGHDVAGGGDRRHSPGGRDGGGHDGGGHDGGGHDGGSEPAAVAVACPLCQGLGRLGGA